MPAAAAAGGTCAVLVTHRLCDTTLGRIDALREGLAGRVDLIVALTEPLGRAAAACGVAEALVLGRDDIFRAEYPLKGASRKIVPGNADLVPLAVRRARPGYARYWYIEYDVWFACGAGVLAELDAATEADLVLPLHDHPRSRSQDWINWPSVVIPPGEAAAAGDPRHALLCLHRASARLLDAVDRAYRRGWAGHFEATLPTIAHAEGFVAERIVELSRRALGRPLLDPRSFRSHGCDGAGAGFIYHPVKTATAEQLLLAGKPVTKGS